MILMFEIVETPIWSKYLTYNNTGQRTTNE